jgi:hypothetical protein
MSAIHHPHHTPSSPETSGEQVFFAMAAAFAVVMIAILGGFFLPVGLAVGMVFVVLAVVLALVGVFLQRVLRD